MATVYDNVVSFCVALSPFCVDVAAICIIDVAAVPGVIWLLFVWCCRHHCVLMWLLSECIGFCLCGNVAFLCVELSPLCVTVINA